MSQPATSTPDCADCDDVQAGTRRLDNKWLCEACLADETRPAAWDAMVKGLEAIDEDLGGCTFDIEKIDPKYVAEWVKAVRKQIGQLTSDSSTLDDVRFDLNLPENAGADEINATLYEMRQNLPSELLDIPTVDAALISDATDPRHALDLYLERAVRR